MPGEPTIRTETVTASDGGTFDAHLTLPESGSGPGILLLQEIFGVNRFIDGKARDLAAAGYVVLAPDVFWRIEPNVALAHDEEAMQAAFGYVRRWSSEVDQETRIGDLLAALAHLKALPEVNGHRTAVLGYCLGGNLAYGVAAAGDPDACVSYYGSGIASQLEVAGKISCPVLFHFGAKDSYIPSDQVAQIVEAFAGRDDVTVRIEPDAGHAFENLLSPTFANPDAASRSWPVTLDWLSTHLG
jgi:carboxymethylenebutenolidase